MANFTELVSVGTDDGWADLSVPAWTDSSYLWIGEWASNHEECAMRFQTVAIPNGATINTAYLTVDVKSGTNALSSNLVMDVFLEDADDPAAVSTMADFAGRVRTSASGTLTFTSTSSGSIQSTSLVTAVQEVVDRSGWATGQDMVVLIDVNTSTNNEDMSLEPYDSSSTLCGRLYVDYTDATFSECASTPAGASSATATLTNEAVSYDELVGPQSVYGTTYGTEYPKAMPGSTASVTGTLTNALLDNEVAGTSAGVAAVTNAVLSAEVEGFTELLASSAGSSTATATMNNITQLSSAFGGATSSNTADLSNVVAASSFKVELTNVTTPGNQALTHSVIVRARATTGVAYCTVKLWEDTTLIHQFDTGNLVTTWAPFSSTLSVSEGEAIVDYDDLQVEVIPRVTTNPCTIQVSEIDVNVPPASVSGIGSYQTSSVGWDYQEYSILGLVPGATYDLGVRAVDIYGHSSSWVADVLTASGDTIAPSTPAGPTVAGSTMNIQVTHYLGVSTGGTFNLEDDLDHLNVYMGTSDGFTAEEGNKLGQIPATASNLRLEIPVIGTFPAPDDAQPDYVGDTVDARWIRVKAVDRSGNESPQSDSASVTAELIDAIWIGEATITDANINDLNAATIDAGYLSADRIAAGSISPAKLDDGTTGAIEIIIGTGGSIISDDGPSPAIEINGDGSASFTDVTISGDLSANNVTGWLTTTSGGIRTGTGTTRIELTSSGLEFYGGTEPSGGTPGSVYGSGYGYTVMDSGSSTAHPYNSTIVVGMGSSGYAATAYYSDIHYWYQATTTSTQIMRLESDGDLYTTGRILAPDGGSTTPSFAFVNSPASGMFWLDATKNYIKIQQNGSTVLSGDGSTEVYLGGMGSGGSTYPMETSGSQIFYDSSSRRFKTDIVPATNLDPDLVLEWDPALYHFKGRTDEPLRLWYIAEDILESSGERFIRRDNQGEVGNTDDKAMLALVVEKIKQHDDRLVALEAV